MVRIPLQIHRGDPVARCTVAIVPWTRITRLHLVSVYGVNRSSPDFHTGNSRLHAELQTYLAGLGNVPWVLGGDWNIEPAELPSLWQRNHVLRAPSGPTHKSGRVLDWFLSGLTVPSTFHNTQIIPGTDHVAVALRLRGALRSTLGFRARQPQGISLEAVRPVGDPQSREHWEHISATPLPHGTTGPDRRKTNCSRPQKLRPEATRVVAPLSKSPASAFPGPKPDRPLSVSTSICIASGSGLHSVTGS